MVESIAPSKHVQCSSNYVPWMTAEQRSEAHLRDNYHKTATKTNNEDDWRLFRRNKVNIINNNNKSNYYKSKLNTNNNYSNNNNTNKDVFNEIPHENYSDKKMWQTAKELTNNSKQQPP